MKLFHPVMAPSLKISISNCSRRKVGTLLRTPVAIDLAQYSVICSSPPHRWDGPPSLPPCKPSPPSKAPLCQIFLLGVRLTIAGSPLKVIPLQAEIGWQWVRWWERRLWLAGSSRHVWTSDSGAYKEPISLVTQTNTRGTPRIIHSS